MPLNEQQVSINGKAVCYYEDGDANPKSLLLLHGEFGNAKINWEPIIPALVAEKFHVVAPDLPGYGGSDAIPGTTFQAQVNWLQSFVDLLGIEQAVVTGVSYGALLARLFAAQYPRYVQTLVLLNGGALPGPAGIAGGFLDFPWIGRWLVDRSVKANTSKAGLQDLVVNKNTLTAEVVAAIQAETGGLARTIRILAEAAAPANKTPTASTLVLWAEQDKIAPKSIGQILAGVIPGAELKFLAGCGHLAHIDAPETVVWQVKAYLDRLNEAKATKK
jgi:pimeloyl-ACP methyl ester carboxylesterase